MKSIALLFALVALVFATAGFAKVSEEEKLLLEDAKTYFSPLPASMIDAKKNADLIELGHKLYMEKKLSRSGTISCNSCHQLDNFGVDNEKTSPGHDGTRGGRNSPTVYNAALNFKQFWDGRAKDLQEQALGPLLNPIEHGLKDAAEVEKILSTDEYSKMFKKAFPGDKKPVKFANVGLAIEAFEKTLLTPSRFDDYLNGDYSALNEQEKRGLGAYMDANCVSCHAGPNLGGSMFRKMGFVKAYKTEDKGVFEVSKKKRDEFKFKVPSLRNITKTGPYLHDGSIKTLDETIAIMGEYQLGVKLSKQEIADIKAFLAATTAKKLPY